MITIYHRHLCPKMTGCCVSPLDLLDATYGGGARSRRQARNHVMDALSISCPNRPVTVELEISRFLPALSCATSGVAAMDSLVKGSGDAGKTEVDFHSLTLDHPSYSVIHGHDIFDEYY